MYSWKPRPGGNTIYFFIEFKHASAVECALKITVSGVRAQRLASSPPHLISNFSAIEPLLHLKRSDAQSTDGQALPRSQAEKNSMPVGHKRRRVSSGMYHPVLSSLEQRQRVSIVCWYEDQTESVGASIGLLKRILTGCRSDETEPR